MILDADKIQLTMAGLNLTLAAVADQLSIRPTSMSRWMRQIKAGRSVHRDRAEKLAEALGVDDYHSLILHGKRKKG